MATNKIVKKNNRQQSLTLVERKGHHGDDDSTTTISISKGLKQRIDEANTAFQKAEDKVKIAYDYAIKVDKLKPKEAAKVLYKRLVYSPQWIRRYLPEEAKHIQKARYDQSYRRGRKDRKGEKLLLEPISDTTTEKEIEDIIKQGKANKFGNVISIPIYPDRVKKFYTDILRIRPKAEKYGLKISVDGSVEVLQQQLPSSSKKFKVEDAIMAATV